MGWGSGTDLFDGALDLFLEYVPEVKRAELIEQWYKKFRMQDWDTEDESKYYDEYLVHILYREDYLDYEEYQYVLAGRPDDWDWNEDH